MVLTRLGLASSSASVIQRDVTSAPAAIISASFPVISSLSRPASRNVEVEPAFGVADRAAGHRIGQDRRKKVQGSVHAHPGVAKVPVDDRVHRLADLGPRPRAGRRRWAISVFAGIGKPAPAIGSRGRSPW